MFENGQEAFDFKPTNSDWRIQQCLRFNLPGSLHLPERIPSHHACQELANPKQVDHIVGDGNCLYRTISLVVCGSQNEHEAVRELIIDTMIRNEKSFLKYVGGDLGNYLSQHTLRPRFWESDVEIFAAGTLLQTTIVVFYTDLSWLSEMAVSSTSFLHPRGSSFRRMHLFEQPVQSFWACDQSFNLFWNTSFKSQKTLHTCWDLEAVTLIPHHLFFPSCPFVLGPNRDVHEFRL